VFWALYIKRLDERETAEELKANREKKPMQKRFFPEGKDNKKRSYQAFRWSRFKNFEPRDMYVVVSEHVFPWRRTPGGNGTTYSKHMEGARFTIPTPALLAKVVDMIDKVPMEDRDTKGDLSRVHAGQDRDGWTERPVPHAASHHPADGRNGRAKADRRCLRSGLHDVRIPGGYRRIVARTARRGVARRWWLLRKLRSARRSLLSSLAYAQALSHLVPSRSEFNLCFHPAAVSFHSSVDGASR
jgi:hypothetical protein